ncbi:hypothetical protein DPMN_185601, partial [Dreissena polymorpha]
MTPADFEVTRSKVKVTKSLYLSHDGLHLSAEGARRCLASIQDNLPNQLCVEAAVQDPTEWPALAATEVPVQEHDSTIALFSDIVQTKRKKMEVKTGKVKREKPTLTKKKNKQEDEINVTSNIHCHRDTEEKPQQDDNAANEDQVNVFRRKKLVIRLANAGRLAGWLAGGRNKLASFLATDFGFLRKKKTIAVAADHSMVSKDSFLVHANSWVENSKIFKTIDEWENTLPDGKINEQTTYLNMCPLHLRSKLLLLLFDEDLSIPTGYYTIEEHYKYLESL